MAEIGCLHALTPRIMPSQWAKLSPDPYRNLRAAPTKCIPAKPPPKMAAGRFTSDNGPHGEHDFGAFDFRGAGKVFWKIDYYDLTLTGRSENPADQAQTTRVRTIILAREY